MPPADEITIIDGHVHARPSHDAALLLSAAIANFDRLGAGAAKVHGMLMLAESVGEESFARWAAHDRPLGRWRFTETDEPVTLLAERDDARVLTIINGRQWTCDDKLEVLTLGSDARLDDGMDFFECIEAGLSVSAMVVLPWGFGKWTGARRERVLEAIDRFGDRLVLGDSAARPGRGRDTVLDAGQAEGVAVLAGTDPLPMGSHALRVGRYATAIDGRPPLNGRWEWLSSQIRSSSPRCRTIGSRDGLLGAIATQVRLRLG